MRILIIQQVAGVACQRAVGACQNRHTLGRAVKDHGVGGHDEVVLRDIVLDQLCAVEHGEAVAQIAQGVVHTGQRVGAVQVQRLIGAGLSVVDAHVLDAGRAGGAALPDVLVVGADGVGDVGVDLIGRTGDVQEAAVLLCPPGRRSGHRTPAHPGSAGR